MFETRTFERRARLMACVLALAGAPAGAALAAGGVSPFAKPSPLPFHAPQFNLIKDSDFAPAIDEGMRRQQAEVGRIADNPAAPTFQNTVVALEKSGRMLNRAMEVFNGLTSANTDAVLQKVQAEEAPKLAANADAIYLNGKLFARVKAVYEHRAALGGLPEAKQLVKVYYTQFLKAGALLPAAEKPRLASLNERLASLETRFEQQLLAATNASALVLDRRSELKGLSPGMIAAAADAAASRGLKGKWVITLQLPTQQPAIAYLKDRAVRHELFEHSLHRADRGGPDDTRHTIAEIAKLRAEKAQLLGFPDFAAYELQDQMAKTPQTVDRFLQQLVAPAVAKEQSEAKILQALIYRDGHHFKLAPWDWEYYARKARAARYHLDEGQVRQYLALENVLTRGLFYAAHRLYGVTFKERKDLPVYQKDVRVFEVLDHTGKPLGLIYFDFFKRASKSGGAWMDNFVVQSKLLGDLPVVYNVENFTRPAPGRPALLSIEDVITLFHEFGHGLNSLFADEVYPSLSGTNTARDFVEYPSQFNERWALDPQVIEHYALNYRTGKPMPASLLAKILRARTFNEGYAFTEELSASLLDMQWHSLPASAPLQDPEAFQRAALQRIHMAIPDVPPRYSSSYFEHIWSSGYAAGYYSYLWTEMLADDSYQWCRAHGGLTRANGSRFRRLILAQGHSKGYLEMFESFYGGAPRVGPLLRYRGLIPAKPAGKT